MTALYKLSIAEAATQIKAGSVKPSQLVEASLERIETLDTKLHGFILVLAERARADAATADAEIAAGKLKGPLHGIPIGLKDIYSTAGIPTTCHSALLEDNIPTEDAHSVALLREAGAINMGKLATHEFAFGGPSFDLPWPPARNPWNIDHVPAGSSSGTGAAIAAGLVMGGMGSDTGGSIRGPAGVNGIAGLKPTFGRISRRGVYPLSWTQDHAGPMARTVEDCALMMQALSGFDPGDPASVDVPVPDFAASLAKPVKGLRVGFVRHWYDFDDGADAETRAVVDNAAKVLSDLGMTVTEITLPEAAQFHATGRLVILSEAWAIHRHHMLTTPEKYGQAFRDRVRLGAFIGSADYIEALRERRRLSEAVMAAMEDVDVLFTANQYGPAERFANATNSFPFFGKPYLSMPFNVTGQPALTVLGGFAESGLPIGVQFAGRPFEDDVVLRVGHAYEVARGAAGRWPEL